MSNTPERSGMNILLVEDSPDDVLLTRRAFKKSGLAVDLNTLGDGDMAIQYLQGEGRFADRREHPFPALVLLDWKLPRRSGLEVLSWIRSQCRLAALPVVVLTTSRQQEDIDQAYAAGANSYLHKPVEFGRLVELMTRAHLYWLQTNITAAV